MVILDEKCMIPPPPYAPAASIAPPPFPGIRSHVLQSLATLPAHLILKLVYMTFPQTAGRNQSWIERQRKTLYWLSHQLRLVNKSFYIACMHVLRSTYLPAYESLIRAPYTSDPYPLSSSTMSPAGPVETVQRETQVLDLFIALKVREDVMMDDTEFHLEREESFKDLFDLMQPRSRLEDLVRYYGLREGVVHTNPPGVSSPSVASGSQLRSPPGVSSPSVAFGSQLRSNIAPGSGTSHRKAAIGPSPLPFSVLSISFSPRKVGLVLTTTGRKRTILEVTRARDDKLEATASTLVKQLKVWLCDT